MARYQESLTPSWQFHLALVVLIPMGFGMVAPLSVIGGAIAALSIYGIALFIFVARAPRIDLTDDTLRAGRATISTTFIGTARVVDKADRVDAIADARTWKLIRAWIPTGVLIDITDPSDPTPSWYLSSRSPEKLVAALQQS